MNALLYFTSLKRKTIHYIIHSMIEISIPLRGKGTFVFSKTAILSENEKDR